MFVGCVIVAAVYIEKEPEKTDASKLAPIFLRFLFRRASHARGAALRGLPLWCLVRQYRRFFCGKNERVRERQLRLARSFRRSETAIPRGRNHASWRQADHAARDRARETGKKKGSGGWRASLLAIQIPDPFSYSLPKQANSKLAFGWGLGRGFGLPKPPP